jgi:hypothetical protein
MHPKKAEALAVARAYSHAVDEALREAKSVARHPGRHGWAASLAAACLALPLAGVGAVLGDLNEELVARTDDATWAFADAGPGDPDRPT